MREAWKLAAKRALIGSGTRLLGRARLAQLGHILLDGARLDVHNRIGANGEREVQRWVLEACPERPVRVFDVGANVGHWTAMLLEEAKALGVDVAVTAFEPAAETYAALERFAADRPEVEAVRAALSDAPGEATFFVNAAMAGSNSLYAVGVNEGRTTETVPLDTLTAHCERHGIEEVTLLKTDCEGHDLAVLAGAEPLLARQAIGVVQFEYNMRWIFGRRFLRDAFELLGPHGYDIGKVTPRGIEFYEGWHPELESYREANYLACSPAWKSVFPALRWWNADGLLGGRAHP
jgi:FkbM family methyltransferase